MTPQSDAQLLNEHKDCECEHEIHFRDHVPAPHHVYGKHDSQTVVTTPYGRLCVCWFCADNCLAKFSKQQPRGG